MTQTRFCAGQITGLLWAVVISAGASNAQVKVVNMVPATRSGETCQDSEPTIAVNLENPSQIAASAFTWDNLCNAPNSPGTPADSQQLIMKGDYAPIYVSVDGGQTWSLAMSVPSKKGMPIPTSDITLDFSHSAVGTTNELYTAILAVTDSFHSVPSPINVLRSDDFRLSGPMFVLDKRNTTKVDQPRIRAGTAVDVSGQHDRVYVGFNQGPPGDNPRSASVDVSLDAAAGALPAFNAHVLEWRPAYRSDGSAIAPAVHPSGTLYIVYYSFRSGVSSGISTDVVVVRDDNWGTGATPFTGLTDPGDNLPGMRVVQGVVLPYTWSSLSFLNMGQQRLGFSDLSIAVDPTNSARVYVAWADQPPNTANQTLHVRRSTDRGMTWSSNDLVTIANAINPALAINSRGRVAFLYQELIGTDPNQLWETHLIRTTDPDGATFDTPGFTLSKTSASTPTLVGGPYLGDYERVVAVDQDFYGVFSAANIPDTANFPSGVVPFARFADWNTHQLYADAAHTVNVAPSIDPFFFHVYEGPIPYDFVQGSDGNLWVNGWNSSQWSWGNLGKPPGATVSGPVGAVTVMNSPTSPQRPYAFVQGSDGNLWVDSLNGSQWSWTNLGKPLFATISAPVGVLTVMDSPTSPQRPYAFVQGSDGNLWANWWNGYSYQWGWYRLGKPPGATISGSVGVVAARANPILSQWPYVFVQGSDGNLWVTTGLDWNWTNLGKPPSATISGAVGVTTVMDSPTSPQRPYAFVQGSDGNLWVDWLNGSQWSWTNLGKPPIYTIIGPVGVTTVMDTPTSPQRPYAFVEGFIRSLQGNGVYLWLNWWNGSQWSWTYLGKPAGASISGPVGVLTVTYSSTSAQRPYGFVQGSDGNLWFNWWNGSQWSWTNLGKPAGVTVISSIGMVSVVP